MKRYGFAEREAARILRGGGSGPVDNWRDSSVCRLLPVEEADAIFFPAAKGRTTWNAAKAMCAQCPVIHRCIEDALVEEANVDGRIYGVRGGLSPDERRDLLAMPVAS